MVGDSRGEQRAREEEEREKEEKTEAFTLPLDRRRDRLPLSGLVAVSKDWDRRCAGCIGRWRFSTARGKHATRCVTVDKATRVYQPDVRVNIFFGPLYLRRYRGDSAGIAVRLRATTRYRGIAR